MYPPFGIDHQQWTLGCFLDRIIKHNCLVNYRRQDVFEKAVVEPFTCYADAFPKAKYYLWGQYFRPMFWANFWADFWADFWTDFWVDFWSDFWADFWADFWPIFGQIFGLIFGPILGDFLANVWANFSTN